MFQFSFQNFIHHCYFLQLDVSGVYYLCTRIVSFDHVQKIMSS